MEIKFLRLEHGWAGMQVTDGEIDYEIDASNVLNDCLLDLLNAVANLYRGKRETYVSFWLEPACYLWRLSLEGEILSVHLFLSRDSIPESITEKYLSRFTYVNTIRTNLDEFSWQLLGLFDTMLAELGPEKHRENWYEYPHEKIEELKKLRKSHKKKRSRNSG